MTQTGAAASAEFQGHAGLRLAADVTGDPNGQPVILLHGGGQTRHSWKRAGEALAGRGYFVLNLDARGHGESDWDPDGDYSMDAFVADLAAVCGELKRAPILVGASLGGSTSLIAVGEGRLSPPPIALVLVDIVTRPDPEGVQRIVDFMRANPEGFADLEEAQAAVAAYNPHRKRPSGSGGLTRNLRPGKNGRLFWHWDPAFMAGPRRLGPDTMRDRSPTAARSIRIPTLLISGGVSEIVTDEGIEDLKALIPHLEVAKVAEAGHMIAGDANDVFNAALLDFLERLPGAGPARAPGATP